MKLLAKLCVCALGICLTCTTACRSSKWQASNDMASLQAQRRQKVEKSVGLKQSEAELQLARDAWTFGDRTASLAALEGILEREPGHVEALLLKAEIHLAKDELIDADRSIAIALSHEPSNATAKRLSEITRTKQLAARPSEPSHPTGPMEAAPMPGGAVSQAAYAPAEPGTALVEDAHPHFPEVAGVQFHPSAGSPADVPPPVAATALATAASDTISEVNAGPSASEVFGPPHDPLASVEATPPFAEALPPFAPLAQTTSTATAAPVDVAEPQVPVLRAESDERIPVLLRPEEATAYERSDVPTGTAEVTDQASSADSTECGPRFQSAIAAGNAIETLALVEQELINNPYDPQIPISAAVAALDAKQPETAASIARLGIAFHPSCAGLHRTLGAALYRLGNYSSSQVALQQALSLDNTAALSYFLMGCVSEKLGDTEAAHTHFARATELDPSLADGQ